MFKKILSLLLVISLVGCSAPAKTTTSTSSTTTENEVFQALLDAEFVSFLESDFLNYHYTIKDGAPFNATKPEVTLGEINLEAYEEGIQLAEEGLARLKEIDVKSLNDEETRQYNILKLEYENAIVNNSTPMYYNHFAPSTGITNNLIVVMEEFKFYNATDVDDYLVLLQDFPRYLQQAMEFTQLQIDAGHFMNDFTVDQTVEGIDKFISKVEDNQFIISFNERIDEMGLENSAKLKEENKLIVMNQIIPMFQAVRDFLVLNKGTTADDKTLASSDEGKEFYEMTVQQRLGTDLSVEQIYALGENYIDSRMSSIRKLYADAELVQQYTEYTIDLETPEEMLDFLQANVSKSYPAGPEVTYQVSYLNPTVTDKNVVAYYLIPPVDAPKENVIRINESAVDNSLDLYTTLAHEGFPGHLYQTTYYFNEDIHPLFKALSVTGYSEGWAMVTELEALNWVADADIAKLLSFDIEYGYIMQAMVDIGVNYKGWGTKEIGEFLYMDDEEILQDLYETVVAEPTQVLPYGFGLVLFKNIEEDAMKKLGNNFDQIEYNQVILKGGSRAFNFVEEDVNAYVKENK